MTPVDPNDATQAGSAIADHIALARGLSVAAVIGAVTAMFASLRSLRRIKTWRARVIFSVSRVSAGAGAGYALALASPTLLGFGASPSIVQLCGIVGGILGADFFTWVSRRMLGVRSREGDY